MKRVRIALEVDEHFVRMLTATVMLDERTKMALTGRHVAGDPSPRQLTAADVVAVVVLAEARGALPEQVQAAIPPEWRDNITALHALRAVRTSYDGLVWEDVTPCDD